MKNIAIIGGTGKVGTALSNQLKACGWSTNLLSSTDCKDWQTVKSAIKTSDIVGITMTTFPDGKAAFKIMSEALDQGKGVVTAEKAAIANHFSELQPYLHRMGLLATVGGGSKMLRLLLSHHTGIERMGGIVNGTFNFLSTQISLGKDISTALTAASAKDLCESGPLSLSELFISELRDVMLKSVLLFNLGCSERTYLKVSDLSYTHISEEYIKHFLNSPHLRLFVHFEKHSERKFSEEDLMFVKCGAWTIYASFTEIEKMPFARPWLPRNEENILAVQYDKDPDSWAVIRGMGAGPIPTAASMVDDVLRLAA